MTLSPDYEKAITIATSLLKHQSPQTVQTLKDLLTFIPNPNHIKDVLTIAVIRLIHTSPQSALWLFCHPEVIEPQIQVKEIIAQELTQKLISLGYTFKDFHFTAAYNLEMDEISKASLLSYQSNTVDRAIITLIYALLASSSTESPSIDEVSP